MESKNVRITHAHLDRKENGDIYGVFKLDFTKNASRFEYCFIGDEVGTLTFDGEVIDNHPTFKSIDRFEGWCRKYLAEK